MATEHEEIIELRRQVELLIRKFADSSKNAQQTRERDAALFQIFARCGISWRNNIYVEDKRQRHDIDGDFELSIDGLNQKFLVEIKNSFKPEIIAQTLKRVYRLKEIGKYDRALIVIPREIPEKLRQDTESVGVGWVDLLGLSDLRSWLCKYIPALQEDEAPQHRTCAHIIREAMRAIAERLALAPEEIGTVEWRDLERVLREVFEGMGFDTTLTRSGKDGGFDLELVTNAERGRETYLVEVKHWTEQKPGKSHLKKLVCVTARQKANYGILLSSSGFAPSIFEGITSADRRTVRLGGRDKIISLCNTYYRIGKQIWEPAPSMSEKLMEDLI